MVHTFDNGHYCIIGNFELNDHISSRKGNCIITNEWKICDNCKYYIKYKREKL